MMRSRRLADRGW